MTRGIKTRNNGRWTEAFFWGQFRSCLRKLSMYWRTGEDYLCTLRRDNTGGGRHKFEYPCEMCGQWLDRKKIELDHKVPVGSLKSVEDLPRFFSRLFVEIDGWQSLCHDCHQKKTHNKC